MNRISPPRFYEIVAGSEYIRFATHSPDRVVHEKSYADDDAPPATVSEWRRFWSDMASLVLPKRGTDGLKHLEGETVTVNDDGQHER